MSDATSCWNGSYNKKVLDSLRKKKNKKRTELISPNTVSCLSIDHCKVIIKAIFKVIGDQSLFIALGFCFLVSGF